jgi:DegV family protein with EDD domain
MQTAVVTDSTSDIPPELAHSNSIQIVPNVMIIEGQELEDGRGISRQEFYQRLPDINPPPTTATSSSGTYSVLYQSLLDEGFSEIVSIHASSLLSGIYNAASAAAQIFGGRVRVIDSEQISLGLGFQVLEIAEQLTKGIQLATILDQLPAFRERVHVVAMLDTLEYVRRSGRVSWARAQLGELLQIKPFLEVKNGSILRYGETRTRQKGLERLRRILHDFGPLERLAILHTNAEIEAREFLASLKVDVQIQPLIVNITTIVGVHVGPNALGIAAVRQMN